MPIPLFTRVADAQAVVILYHANCPDGFGAAYCAWKIYGDAAQYVPYKHGDKPPVLKGKNVVMMDCCYHKDDAVCVHNEADSFITLDHHKTALEDCGDLDFCHFDMKRSGMGIAWDYFHPTVPRPALVEHVEDRDLWRWSHPDSRAFCLKLNTVARDFATWDMIASIGEFGLAQFIAEGRAMETQTNVMIETFCKEARKVTFLGYRVWLLNVPRALATDECGARLGARDDTDFALMWTTNDLQEIKLSFRSANGFDVSKVAQQFGGGGHAAASGAKVTFDVLQKAVTL